MRYVPPRVEEVAEDSRLGGALVSLVREGLDQRGRLCLRLQGDSMWPTILPGSLVEVERLSPDDVRLGDIVIWPQDGNLIAHRVVQRKVEGSDVLLVTKGDNASGSDQMLPQRVVIGRVARVHGQGEPGLQARQGAAFWVWRWRVRSLLGRVGGLLPRRLRSPLIRFRNRLGHYLSLGLKAVFLR